MKTDGVATFLKNQVSKIKKDCDLPKLNLTTVSFVYYGVRPLE